MPSPEESEYVHPSHAKAPQGLRSTPLLAGLAAAALFGAATPAGKHLLGSLTPLQLAGLLYLGAAVGVLPLVLKEPRRASLARRSLARLAGAVVLGGILGPVLLLMGLQQASAASVSIWLNLELLATVVLGYLLFKDHLTWPAALAAVGTLAASVLLSASGGMAGIQAGVLVLAACFCWGFDNHLTALIDELPPSHVTFWKGLAAGLANLALGGSLHAWEASAGTVVTALVVGAFSYGFSIVLYVITAQQIGASRGQILFATAPFFGVLFSWTLLGEPATLAQAAALVLIAISMVPLFRESHSHRHAHEATAHEHWHSHDDGHHDHGHEDGHHDHRPDDAGREERVGSGRPHSHWHRHRPRTHTHPHLPDLHHRHDHKEGPDA